MRAGKRAASRHIRADSRFSSPVGAPFHQIAPSKLFKARKSKTTDNRAKSAVRRRSPAAGLNAFPAPCVVPDDFDRLLRALGARLQLTQSGLGERVGAAHKAGVYQWESRRRRPSPALWREGGRQQ